MSVRCSIQTERRSEKMSRENLRRSPFIATWRYCYLSVVRRFSTANHVEGSI
ncbi:hypothetical protein KCP69_22065 [Salmonella enterica subsp. enterica]|nr:hypothetical protein KCP69_22065 [Salmonella enterica subsp. enterica]